MQKGNSTLRYMVVMTRKKLSDALKRVKFVTYCTLNAPRTICDHVVGEHHSLKHRMLAGGGIIAFGAMIGHLGAYVPGGFVVHLTTDTVGLLIHGIGAIPFVETVAKGGTK